MLQPAHGGSTRPLLTRQGYRCIQLVGVLGCIRNLVAPNTGEKRYKLNVFSIIRITSRGDR